jgi:GntR family transcriptional regulator, transcriptional repressor for pyruvate dehydrogenase complex
MKPVAAATASSPPSEAAQRIRQYILRRHLKPGDQLPTHDVLGRQLKVGPRRLREGLSILRYQGIVETRNKGGTIVRRPSFKTLNEPIRWHLDSTGYQLEDLVAARAWLESGAAAEAAEHRTARDLLKILDAFEQLEPLIRVERSDWPEDETFHLAIMEASHNPVIVTFGQLVRLNFQSQSTAIPPSVEQRRTTSDEHRAIYNAIERQDRATARDIMYTHVMGQLHQSLNTKDAE